MLLFAFTALLMPPAYSQYQMVTDTSNTFRYGTNVLLDRPLPVGAKILFVDDNENLIPAEKFPIIKIGTRPTGFDSLLIAKKTTLAQNLVTRRNTHNNDMIEFAFSRFGYGLGKKDTLKGIDDKVTKYHPLPGLPVTQSIDSILVYYAEEYGSGCCPHDPKWDLVKYLQDFTTNFEKKYKVKIGDVYYHNNGKEGEHICYYTLSGLSGKQKIEFITERLYAINPNNENKDMVFFPTLFMPYWVRNYSFQKYAE